MPVDKNLFARRALDDVAKLLTLQDRNPHSSTYGCFDRKYWHFRAIDFPSGMAQEFVWPLALAASTDLPENAYHDSAAVRDWVEAGIRFAARAARSDGWCDDYYPYERATGAAAFSLLACLESYRLLGLEDGDLVAFFERRADALAAHRESGTLSNHEALVVLCLATLAKLIGSERWNGAIARRLERLLSWQSTEGWFREYEGCDPGYLTLTISLLASLDAMSPELDLHASLTSAVRFAAEFIHPDGSYGGEYGCRNTYNFFPHGFELVGRFLPEALSVNDRFLEGLANGLAPCYADDHGIGHHTWSYLLAWRDFVEKRPSPPLRPEGRRVFPEAGLLIERREGLEIYVALNKGGVFKLFRDGEFVASDTHLSLLVRGRSQVRNAVGHLIDSYKIALTDEAIGVSGSLGWAKEEQMTTLKLIILRVVMLSFGRFFPNLVRRLLQRLLITGKRAAPFTFRRTLGWKGGSLQVRDELAARSWNEVEAAGIGGHQTSIYVVMSRPFQAGQLMPWQDLTQRVRRLDDGEQLIVERRL